MLTKIAEKKRLGEMLIDAGVIDEIQLSSALGYQKQWGGHIGSILITMGVVSEKTIASVLEQQTGIKCISLDGMEVSPDVLNTVKKDTAKKYDIFPLKLAGKTLTIATSDPTDLKTLDDLSFVLGFRVTPLLALESDIKRAIALHYEGKQGYGVVPKADTCKAQLPESAQQAVSESADGKTRQTSRTEPAGEVKKEGAASPKTVIEALITLLIEKNVITRDELLKKIRERM